MLFGFVGMRPPLKISTDEAHQFATQKRVAFGASPSHAPKKSQTTDPSIALSSIDILLVAPSTTVGTPAVVLRAPTAEAPPTITRSEEDDVVIVDASAAVSTLEAKLTIPVPAP